MAMSEQTAKPRGDKNALLVVICVAALVAGLLYALRQRGPVRGVPADAEGIALLVERTDRPVKPWRSIVIHHSATSAGSAAAFDRAHRLGRGWESLGYHFVIGNGRGAGDGEIEVGPRWRMQRDGAHARGMNDLSIGICLVGDFTRTYPTEAQMRHLVELARYLQQRFTIPKSRVHLHSEVSPSGTLCPGKHFPASAFRAALRD